MPCRHGKAIICPRSALPRARSIAHTCRAQSMRLFSATAIGADHFLATCAPLVAALSGQRACSVPRRRPLGSSHTAGFAFIHHLPSHTSPPVPPSRESREGHGPNMRGFMRDFPQRFATSTKSRTPIPPPPRRRHAAITTLPRRQDHHIDSSMI